MSANLPRELRVLVTRSGVKRKDIAEQLGTSHAYVSAVLHGQKNISPDLLDRLLKAIGSQHAMTRRRMHRLAARDHGWDIGP